MKTGHRVTVPRGVLIAAWGVFCACSWTWCIGMFLPKVLVDRHGFAGFVVFALPNVLGCRAGFGYVLGTGDRSRRLVEDHAVAMTVFSIVAVAFNLFFAAFLATIVFADAPDAGVRSIAAPVVVFIVGLGVSRLRDPAWLGLAGLVYVVSLIALVSADGGGIEYLRAHPAADLDQLAWLTPIIVVGFLLCPLLDLTFHRALQQSPSRHAFGVFGVTFTVAIALTLLVWFARRPLMPLAIAHLVAQTVFTVGAHLREIRRSSAFTRGSSRALAMLAPLLAVTVLPVVTAMSDSPTAGVDTYVRFFVWYGLVFPAYALAFIGPWRPATLSARSAGVLGGVVIALAPLYELGFLHGRGALLGVPVVVMLGWAVTRGRSG